MLTKLVRKEEGFTLIELLVVVAIIALLTAFAVPRLFEAINKSKGAQGNSDLETVGGAIERHYMDKSFYPKLTTGQGVKDALKVDYLKSSTNWLNGFSRQYIYISDANGSFFVLVDPKNQPNGQSVVVTCNGKKADGTAISGTATATVKALDPTTLADADKVPTLPSANSITPEVMLKGKCEVTTYSADAEKPALISN